MKKILILTLLISVSATVVVAGVNTAIENKNNAAQPFPRVERVPVKIPMETVRNQPCPPPIQNPKAQTTRPAPTKTIAPDEGITPPPTTDSTTPKDVGVEMDKVVAKTPNATPTVPCVKPPVPAKQTPNPLMKLIKRAFGTTPARQPALPTTPGTGDDVLFPQKPGQNFPPDNEGGAPEGELFPQNPPAN